MKWYYENGAVIKPHPTIFGYKRRNVLIIVAIVLALIILIIGLAVGLTQKNRNSMFTPSAEC